MHTILIVPKITVYPMAIQKCANVSCDVNISG